ncbi:hypothetical protein TNCV_1508971 [Trichonephila clavipes]|nr:hypothetical protein TNCV_1508971 [Trichonephila clavipes]
MPIQRDKPSNFDEKTENIPTQRDKPSHLGEKTEDMPTQRDKPSHLGVKTTIALDDNEAFVSLGQVTKLAPNAEIQVFERYRSGQVAFQAEQFVNV